MSSGGRVHHRNLPVPGTVGWAEASTIVVRRLGCTAYAESGHTMNPEAVLAVLPDSKEEAESLKEIAFAMGLETSTHTYWIRTQRTLIRVLRILINGTG